MERIGNPKYVSIAAISTQSAKSQGIPPIANSLQIIPKYLKGRHKLSRIAAVYTVHSYINPMYKARVRRRGGDQGSHFQHAT